jgi:hypothetical protein
MTIWDCITCNQYMELKERGKERAARQNGTLLVAIVFLSHFLLLVYGGVWLIPGLKPAIVTALGNFFGAASGSAIGRFIALPMIGVFYLIARYTIGTQRHYETTIREFNALPPEKQKRISTAGIAYFFISLATGVLSILVFR